MPAAKKVETNETFDTNTIFNKLNSVDVSEKIEKKNGLSYLSWAWAWAEVKKRYPNATFTIYERETEYGPVNYFTDGRTCWVKTGLTIDGLEHIEELPVMNFSNRSIPLDAVTSTDINKAIQRSLTKAAARHGLGLYIYAGEDMPEQTDGDGTTGVGDAIDTPVKKAGRPAKKPEAAPVAPPAPAEHTANTATVIAEIDAKLAEIGASMAKEDKLAFAKETIAPIIGSMNYKTCTDIDKLTALKDKLCA